MLSMHHKVFQLGLERFRWSWRFGPYRLQEGVVDFRARVAAFANEVGPENVVSITEGSAPHYTITVWYREEVRAKPKPARVGVDDEYFAGVGG